MTISLPSICYFADGESQSLEAVQADLNDAGFNNLKLVGGTQTVVGIWVILAGGQSQVISPLNPPPHEHPPYDTACEVYLALG